MKTSSFIAFAALGLAFCPAEGTAQNYFPYAANNAALQALPVKPAMVNTPVLRLGFHAPGDGGAATYVLQDKSCAFNNGKGDDGAQVYAGGGPGSSYCWLISPPTIVDPRVWGAYGDVQRAMRTPVAITADSCSVTLDTATFSQGDVGKKIVITDYIGNNKANGPTYTGMIESVAGPSQITVARPCPDFSTKLPQNVFWGHDDAAALNAAIQYIDTRKSFQSAPTLTQLNGGGLDYGACSAFVDIIAPVDLENIGLSALCADNMPVETSGLLTLRGPRASYTTGNAVELNGDFLPVNVWYIAENGTTRWHHVRVFNWLGSGASTPVSVKSNPAATLTGSISDKVLTVTGIARGVISPGQALIGAGVKAGTVIQSYDSGIGGTGTYLLSSPQTASSQTMKTLGNNLTIDGAEGLAQGMISHGNGPLGIRDRAMIVAINNNVITLNKPPTEEMNGQRVTFYRDSNGIVLAGGAHLDAVLASEVDGNIGNVPDNHYGCGLLYKSGSQSDIINSAFNYGVANICLTGEARGLYLGTNTDLFQNWNRETELNPASIIMMDGATNLVADRISIFGQIQLWNVTKTAAPGLNVRNLGIGISASNLFAPNNWFHIYTELPNTAARRIAIDPFGDLINSPRPQILFAAAEKGSWKEFSPPQIAAMSQSRTVALPNGGTSSPDNHPNSGQDGQ